MSACVSRLRFSRTSIERVAFRIDLLRAGSQSFGGNSTHDVEDAAVIVDHVLQIFRHVTSGIIPHTVGPRVVGRPPLLNFRDFLEIEMVEKELNVLIIRKIVGHGAFVWK